MHAPINWSLSSEPKLTGCPVILRMAGAKFLYVPECHPDIQKSPYFILSLSKNGILSDKMLLSLALQ